VIITLRDGTRVAIRPLEPDDRDALAEGFARLSPESRYRRFFAPVAELRQRDLDYLTRVDHHDHEALVAVDPQSGEGIGVARYVRTGPDVAEPAMVVADDWQGRGVASRLLDALARRALEEGIERFEAPVLAGNDDAIRVLERLGETTRRPEGREVLLKIALRPPEPAAAPGLGELLRHFAAGTLEPARSVLDLLWPRRRGAPDDPRRNVIVVGTDGSEHAERAVAAAAELAAASGASVEVVGAHRFLLAGERDELDDAVRTAAAGLRERGLHVHEHVRRGDPALVLTDLAAERRARLVVVGAGDRSKTARRLIGGVADLVAERAPCAVLIVRPRAGAGAKPPAP
jgi:nucleotide-binding universal stress UspA family protein